MLYLFKKYSHVRSILIHWVTFNGKHLNFNNNCFLLMVLKSKNRSNGKAEVICKTKFEH